MTKRLMVKASLFTLIVAFMAFGTMAIAKAVITNETPVNKTVTTEIWYFHGGNPEIAENYLRKEVDDKPCGSTPQTICQILAPEDGINADHPDLGANVGSTTVLKQIQDAMTSMESEATTNETVTSFRSF